MSSFWNEKNPSATADSSTDQRGMLSTAAATSAK